MLKLVKAKKTVIRTNDAGQRETIHPGGYFYARNQEIRGLLATGQIERPCDVVDIHGLQDCGVVVLTGDVDGARSMLAKAGLRQFPVTVGDYTTRVYRRTLYLDPALPLRPELIPVGFTRLGNGWEMAIPLCRYTTLAAHLGTPADRDATAAVIHDLRVPVYELRAIFAQDTPAAAAALSYLATAEGNASLALLRGLYQHKPVLCALPTTWVR